MSKSKLLSYLSQELWETSGHWFHYRENMYAFSIEERHFAIKPMNCPGCMLYFKSQSHSYRELPLRVAEIGHVHRHEASGALSGFSACAASIKTMPIFSCAPPTSNMKS